LSTFWGVLADCDINSEVLRWMGPSRFTVWGAMRVFCPRAYPGSIFYSGQKVRSRRDAAELDEHNFTPELPDIHEEAHRHEEDEKTQFKDQVFSYVLMQNTPFIGKDINSGPLS